MAEYVSALTNDPNKCGRYNAQNQFLSVVACSTTSTPSAPAATGYTSKLPEDPNRCGQYNSNHQFLSEVACQPASTPWASGSFSVTPTASPGPNAGQTAPGVGPTPTGAGTRVPPSGKNGVPAGAVAGIAIGMLLVGALIAGAVFFFLLRRQKSRQSASYPIRHLPPASYTAGPEKGPIVVASAVQSSIDNLLPQPESDDTITSEVSKIRDNIKNHIRTYYHSAPVTGGINEAALNGVASATGLSSSVLVGALLNPSARQDALRLVVAWVILSKATDSRNADLLPFKISQLLGAFASTDVNTKHTTLYSKWKTITGTLLQQGLGKNAQDPNRAQVFASIVSELDSIVSPFVQGNVDESQRRKNLEMMLARAANFAFLLFSQPGSFQLDYVSRRGGTSAFPALLQTIGDQGQILSPPRVLFEGETMVV